MTVFQILVTYLPLVQPVFRSASLSLEDWILVITPALAIFTIVELEKAFTRRRKPKE